MSFQPIFKNRKDAGEKLGRLLTEYSGDSSVVLGLTRGGVPVADQVAKTLESPMDVIVVRKIGARFQPEFALGAIAEGGELALNAEAMTGSDEEAEYIHQKIASETEEINRRAHAYRKGKPALDLKGKTAIIVDDGLATGMTAIAAAKSVLARNAKDVVLAFPVCACDSANRIKAMFGFDVRCMAEPPGFRSVGSWYEDFDPVTDDEVVEILNEYQPHASVPQDLSDEDVLIELPGATLQGYLHIPENAVGVVAFAHGTGSSRHSPRNQRVAAALNHHRIGTLLLDLLTEDEERLDAIDRHLAFDIGFLSERMVGIVNWLMADVRTSKLPVGLFGASTGAAAALSAAAELKDAICAVVSRGGRPDLAADALYEVQVATLLIVGGLDDVVIDLNKSALERIPCTDKKLVIVPGATHLFEEHGTLDQVVDYTVAWFSTHFVASRVQRISVR